jgi:hypothetical protein
MAPVARPHRGRAPHEHDVVDALLFDDPVLVTRCGLAMLRSRSVVHRDLLASFFDDWGHPTCGHCRARRPPAVADVPVDPAYL